MRVRILSLFLCGVLLTGCGSTAVTASTASTSASTTEQSNIATTDETVESSAIATTEATVEERKDTDFRNTCWGDSLEDVKKYETADFYAEQDSSLIYNDSLSGHDVNVVYTFKNDKLINAGYLLAEDCTTGGQYINILNSWYDSLVKKYGKQNSDNNGIDGIYYTVDKDQANSVDEGTALEYGYTGYIYTWKLNKTLIRLVATSEEYKVHIVLMYQDLNNLSSGEDDSKF